MAGEGLATVASMARVAVAGPPSATTTAGARGAGAAGVICGRTKNEANVVLFMTRDALTDDVEATGLSGPQLITFCPR